MFIGKLGENNLMNYFIILATCKFTSGQVVIFPKSPILMVDLKYPTEKYIASKNYTERKFQAKWNGISFPVW